MTPYYQDDHCTIYHGDNREVLPSLPDTSVDLAFADPPYGVGFSYAGSYDDEGGAAYEAWMGDTYAHLTRVAPIVMVTPGIRNMWAWPRPTWVLGWHKPGSTRRGDLGGFNVWEPVLMYGKRRIHNDALRLPDVANHSRDTGCHPCPKPLRLLTWLISNATDEGATVLDPFMGSGTTLRAAKDLGRKAIGIEVEERYCEVAARRLAQEVLDLSA